MATIPRRSLAGAVAARLAGVTSATGYVAEIGPRHGLPGVENTPKEPPKKSVTDPRVAPYFVLYPGLGRPGDEVDLGETLTDLDVLVTITAAAGDVDDLLALVDRIHDRLWRWAPDPIVVGTGETAHTLICGPLRTPPGYDPPLLLDRAVTPPRHYTPLQYVFTAHT